MTALTQYGPGKFSLMIDAYVHEMSLSNCDEECGDVSENGVWYGLVTGSLTADLDEVTIANYGLSPEDIAFLSTAAGAILSEDDQGFVSVEYFSTASELESAWANVTAEVEDSDADDDTPAFRCDQCEALMINGVFCHETGCPNARKTWDADREEWVKYLKCRYCGCDVEEGEPCDCQMPDNDDSFDSEEN